MTQMEPCPVPLAPIHELNERCLDLLAHAARAGSALPLSLPDLLHDELLRSTPDSRQHAAQRQFLLLDLEFRNLPWWRAAARSTEQPHRGAPWRSPFVQRTAIRLTRVTVTVAWQAIQCELNTACLLLGMDPSVARLIVDLPVTTLDRIAGRYHRYLQPRWADRPAYWRDLLQAAERKEAAKLRSLDAQGLQLLTGDLLSDAHARQFRTQSTRTGFQAEFPVGRTS